MKKSELLMKIGQRIEAQRIEMGLSKTKFAKLIDTSRPQLERLINGEVNSSIVKLNEICGSTGMELGDLIK